jgi:hypothetical protein
MQINSFTQRLEGTIMATEHDLEIALKDEGLEIKELSTSLKDSSVYNYLQDYINLHFQMSTKSYSSDFRLVGFESFLNGQIYLYIESNPLPDEYTGFEVRFDLLMDTFTEQQNKLTIYAKGISRTVPFVRGDASQLIELKNG